MPVLYAEKGMHVRVREICLQGCKAARAPASHPLQMFACLLMAREPHLSHDGCNPFLPPTTQRLSAIQKETARKKDFMNGGSLLLP